MSASWNIVAPKLNDETQINDLAVLNGEIYGGTGGNGKLYKWNGSDAWVEVAPKFGTESQIFSLVVMDGVIYGGTGGNGKLYKWNGSDAWIEVAPKFGTESQILSLVVLDGYIYGSTTTGKLLKWNGSNAWTQVAPGLASVYVYSLTVFNGYIYGAAGSSRALWRWNGSNAWTQVAPSPGGSFGSASCLAVFNNELYAGITVNAYNRIYKWNGSDAWIEVATNASYGDITSIVVMDGGLYCGTNYDDQLLKWDGATSLDIVASPLGENSLESLCTANGKIYGGTYPNGRLLEWDPNALSIDPFQANSGITSTLAETISTPIASDPLSGSLSINADTVIIQPMGLRSVSETIPYTSEVLIDEPSITDGSFLGGYTWSDFEGGDGSTQSYGIDLGLAREIKRLQIHLATQSPYGLDAPTGWDGTRVFDVYRSDDNNSWTYLESFTNPEIFFVEYFKFYIRLILSNPVTARYFKVVSTGAVKVKQYVNGVWDTETVSVAEFIAGDIVGSATNIVPAEPFDLNSSIDPIILITHVIEHEQRFSDSWIIVSREVPVATLSLKDDLDGIEFLGGAALELSDPSDSISFSAKIGTAATLSLSDPKDAFSSLNGGELALKEPTDSLSFTGQSEVIGSFALIDSKDTAEFNALAGIIGSFNLFDLSDEINIEGLTSSIGFLNLLDSNDTIFIQALPGGTAEFSLFDPLDSMDIEGFQELRGELSLEDIPDAFILTATSNRFAGHIIQYQASRF